MDSSAIEDFLHAVSARLGYPALSEAKMMALRDARQRVMIAEDDQIVAVGVVARHRQSDGSVHHAIETVVRPDMQFPEFERTCVEATLDLVPGDTVSAWSRRSTLDEALESLGFRALRTLIHMVVDLPISAPTSSARPLAPGEIEELIDLNNRAFAGHREAGALTRVQFDELAAEPWFDRDGIVVLSDGVGLAAFCWTKMHANGDGEIYRIGVRPDMRGSGLGRAVTLAGFEDLATRRGCLRGTLWVEEGNDAAVELYESLGLVATSRNREYERS